MLNTVKGKTGVASFVIWRKPYRKQRRIIFSTDIIVVFGRLQGEGK